MSDAAAELMRHGHQPTVAEAAEAAGVHRATAYRYFPTAKSLLAEAALAVADIDPDKVFADAGSDDPLALVDAAVAAVCQLMFAEESLFRHNLLVALEQWFVRRETGERPELPYRSARRFQWIDPIIEPLADALGPDQFRRLRFALALTFGAEAVVVTRDVCRLEPDEATEVMRWAAGTLMRAAVADINALRVAADADAEASEMGHG